MKISERPIDKQKVYVLGVTAGQMCCHGASQRPPKAPDLATDAEFLKQELENCLTVMVAGIRVGISLGPSVVSIVPSHHIYLVRDKEF